MDVDAFSLHTFKKVYHYVMRLNVKVNILFLKAATDERKDETLFMNDELTKLVFQEKVANVWTETVYDFGVDTFYDSEVYINNLKKEYITPHHITHLIMVNFKETWLGDLFKGSLSETLATSFLGIDSAVIGSGQAHPFNKEEFAAGKWAWISKSEENKVMHMSRKSGDMSGLYFKKKATDFDHGIFMKGLSAGETQYKLYKVTDGEVKANAPMTNRTIDAITFHGDGCFNRLIRDVLAKTALLTPRRCERPKQ
ncbi:hypothetical protein HUG15_16995 [Salicibibacter cibarius]|uniref:Uncharacterized protein n=1 Tax=Salicibibacter cibarius TaxID=2743000 RepID=A0A7T7CCN9_9BACI|nr:hypothetical protein [Salicibibacter cibarius]QQK77105.1 hypothetical protein HUG15_16995 [Salicibibacter cibarius]